VSRRGPSVDGSLTTLGVVLAGVVLLSLVTLQNTAPTAAGSVAQGQPGDASTSSSGGGSTNGSGPVASGVTSGRGAGGTGSTGNGSGTGGVQAGPLTGPQTQAGCDSRGNGGSTDRGVTATSIKLGATVVQGGIGASFLGPVRYGLKGVADKVNKAGGICGRRLDLKLLDDNWDPNLGFQYIQNLVQDEKVFALAVNPSSEGLRIASGQKYFARTQTPVVGSDGMLNDQYQDPWVWPIAASTVSTMHIMASDACNRLHKQHFSIVFDSKYHFGVEGAYAFNAAVKRCTGSDIPGYTDPRKGTGGCTSRFCAISAGQTSYDTDNKTYNDQCFKNGVTCDFLALLLEPNEATNFLRNGTDIQVDKGMAQTLFTRDFAAHCGTICDGALIWTGYNPPIEEFATLPAVKDYVETVRAASRDADVLNQFLEGGYAGMTLLVNALKQVGPNLTRQRLAAVLDATDFSGGLTTPLKWRPGNHFANAAMQAFAIEYKGSFNGFRSVVPWVRDPYLGMDVK
jgi:ABC-type branched-subunit amino acid transport system substrate-binding protein